MTFSARPDGVMRRPVTNTSRLRFLVFSACERKSLPMNGRSPRNGTLSSIALRSSVMRPPMTTVAPGVIETLDSIERTWKKGCSIGAS